MNSKYIWNKNEIKFVDKDDSAMQNVEYSAVSSSWCPFDECSYNTSCNGKCLPSQEEKAYDLACQIYDSIGSEIAAENDTYRQLELLKKQVETHIESSLDKALIMCIKIQLLNELKTQCSKSISKDEVRCFLEAEDKI